VNGSENEELVARAREQANALLEQARADADEVIRRAAEEVDELRREVLDATGVEIVEAPPPKVPAVHDVCLGHLAKLAVQCHHLLAAVELLKPHVQVGSARTVGAVLKTGVPLSTATMAVHWLNKSGFFAAEERP